MSQEQSITVTEFDALIEKAFELKDLHASQKEAAAATWEEFERLQGKIVMALKEQERDTYASPRGRVTISEKWRVKLPVDDAAKEQLFKHLTERGIFMKYATVNANSLNSLFMQDWEAAKRIDGGIGFLMPGVEAPTLAETLHITKAKG